MVEYAFRAWELLQAGYRQVSRKHRSIARLPTGMTGLQALATKNPAFAARLLADAEESATEHYLRVYAPCIELSPAEFETFSRVRKERDSKG